MKETQNLEKNRNFYEFNYEEFYIIKENIIYKIIIHIDNNEIKIKSKNYEIVFDFNKISLITKEKFLKIIDAYDFIVNIFNENKVNIKNVHKNKEIILNLKTSNNKNIEISLLYNEKNNKDFLVNEIIKLKKEINDINIENNKLKEEINILKKYHSDESPEDIQFSENLTKDSYADDSGLVNTFTVFNSINNILYLIYSNRSKSIICYDLLSKKIKKELKTYSNKYITSIRHYLDEKNTRDIIMSISSDDNNIKLWNINNYEMILNLQKVNNKGYLFSGCFLKDNNQSYIVSSNLDWNSNMEPIKIFDFEGNKIKQIKDSNDKTMFIDTFYDKKMNKNFVIACNENYIKSYDYNMNELYHKYYDNENGTHNHFVIKSNEEKIKMIESCNDGNVRIWDFHSGLLINKIKGVNKPLIALCLWNNSYIFVGCKDNKIKLVDIKKGVVVKSFDGHNQTVLTIKKINHPQFGESLVSQGYMDDQIKFWKYNN